MRMCFKIACKPSTHGNKGELAFGVGPPVHVSRRSVVFACVFLRLSVFCMFFFRIFFII
jgi:hypothetical protein